MTTRDARTGEERTFGCRAVISAAGAWAGTVAALAGATLHMSPGKGSMLILNRRLTSAVVNRLAPPGDGDILVPVHTVCILGTTDITVEDPDDASVTRDEVTALLADGDRLVPGLSSARILRAYAGSRPLYDAGELEGGQPPRRVARDQPRPPRHRPRGARRCRRHVEHRRRQADDVPAHGPRRRGRRGAVARHRCAVPHRPTRRCPSRPAAALTGSVTGWPPTRRAAAATPSSSANASS